jgi:hypothetical protein
MNVRLVSPDRDRRVPIDRVLIVVGHHRCDVQLDSPYVSKRFRLTQPLTPALAGSTALPGL